MNISDTCSSSGLSVFECGCNRCGRFAYNDSHYEDGEDPVAHSVAQAYAYANKHGYNWFAMCWDNDPLPSASYSRDDCVYELYHSCTGGAPSVDLYTALMPLEIQTGCLDIWATVEHVMKNEPVYGRPLLGVARG